MSNTSIGPGELQGGNENHDGDPRNTTLGEKAPAEEPPAGAELVAEAAPEVTAGVPGSELEAARGKKTRR